MSFLLLEAVNLRKSFADRLILDIDVFRIYAGDRIGFVGANGSGKTTLLDILSGNTTPDEGSVRRYCDVAYIRQFGQLDTTGHVGANEKTDRIGDPDSSDISGKSADSDLYKFHLYGVADKTTRENISGGESARLKIACAMGEARRLVFADEPTSNLDMQGVALFGQELAQLDSFVLISHDRDLLNTYCNKIMTLEDHTVVMYDGDFEAYRLQTALKKERAMTEYEQYQTEKERLQKVYTEKKTKAAKVAKKPKGMSSSEIKQRDFIATSRSNDGRQRSFERAAKAVQARIDHMAIKEKPDEPQRMKLDFTLTEPPANKIVLSGRDVTLGYKHLTLFNNAVFEVQNRARVALIGANGSGKTTLLNAIYRDDPRIYRVPKARIGYFYQGFEQIDFQKSVLQNALRDSVQRETTVRSMLARLLFTRNDVNKPAGVLSGGERIKLSFAMLLVAKNNVLLLDEPTNYLDMPSIEVLQEMLSEYEGTLLFVSHDRVFVNAVCTSLLVIENQRLTAFAGNLDDYAQKKTGKAADPDSILLEHRLAALAGEIAQAGDKQKEALEADYMALLAQRERGE